ncbi:MAG: dihydrolipoyl dehydrogenase [Candidatus Auribacterota bacterium]|nr:dihydrolipoyl dehydrogenase [Candidatus Auribacterota bacterium]
MKKTYDIVIIGAGPGGYVAAIRAAQLGLKTAIVDRQYWGGVCLNIGCIPTKSLLRNAELARLLPSRAKEFGCEGANISWDYGVAFKRSRRVSDRLVKGVKLLLRKNKIDCRQGSAYLDSPRSARIKLSNGEEETLDASNIIIATGARPASPPGLKIDGEKIISYREAIMSPDPPESCLIIGGGPIGMEFTYLWSAYGTEITIVEMLDHLLPTEDAEASAVVERAYKKMKIAFHLQSRVEAVEKTPDGIRAIIRTPKGEVTIEAEQAMVATGFKPNVEDLGLEEIGISQTKRGQFIEINDRMETNIDGIYAIGDVTGKLMLAHTASAMGIAAAEAIAGQDPAPIDYRMIPRCVYCHPQVAAFGYTEEEARNAGLKIKIGKFPFLANGKALGLGERDGFVKIIAEEDTGKILGASLVGPEVTELLPELTLAQMNGLTVEDIARNIHGHPTLSETIQEAAHAASGKAIHL